MNKRLLWVAALCAAMNLSAHAQENLALNKDVKASSETGGEPAKNIVDGDLTTRWQIDAANEGETSTDGTVTKGHWIYVDLGEAKEFNALRIKWENAYAKKFKVLVATDVDADSQEPKWQDAAVLTEDKALTDLNRNYTYFLDSPVTARYVKLEAEELGFGNYLSLYELGIYNYTDEQKQPVVTEIKAGKKYVAPGGEFTVSVTDQFDNAMTSGITYTCENATEEGDGKFKATAAGKVTVTAKDAKGNERTVELEAYTPVLTSAEVTPTIVVTGVETPLSFIVKDQKGEAIANFTTSATGKKITAAKDGEQEITVTYGEETKKVKVYAVSTAKPTPQAADYDEEIFFGDENGLAIGDPAWNEHFTKKDIVEINGNKMWRVSNVGSYCFQKGAITGTDYKTLNFDIFPTTNVENGYVRIEGAGTEFQKIPLNILKGGEWNHVIVDVEGAESLNGYIHLYLGKAGAENNPSILLDNVYLSKTPITDLLIGRADDNGLIPVKGVISADNIDKLKEVDGTAFDFSKTKLAEGYAPTKIEMKNPNAIIVVPGTVTDGKGTPTTDWGAETKNLVVKKDYYYPVKQLEITDGYPVMRSFYITTGTIGYKYTRSLKAKTYSTVYLPVAADIPAGCTAYEMVVDDADANNIVLKQVQTIAGQAPYIIYNGNAEATDLVMTSTTGDMNFAVDDANTEVGNLQLHGTYRYFNGDDDTLYGIQDEKGENGKLTLKKIGTGAAVAPFRVYFTVKEGASSRSISFDLGGTTGIKTIAGADAAHANNVYSIEGKLVKAHATDTTGLAKGVYIINGKKFIVK